MTPSHPAPVYQTLVVAAVVVFFLGSGVVAIVLPWISLKTSKRDGFRTLGIINAIICGWHCLWIGASFFIPVMPSYTFLLNPLLGLLAVVLWWTKGRSPPP